MEYYALVPLGFPGGGPQAIWGKMGDCGSFVTEQIQTTVVGKTWGLEFMMHLQLSGKKVELIASSKARRVWEQVVFLLN